MKGIRLHWLQLLIIRHRMQDSFIKSEYAIEKIKWLPLFGVPVCNLRLISFIKRWRHRKAKQGEKEIKEEKKKVKKNETECRMIVCENCLINYRTIQYSLVPFSVLAHRVGLEHAITCRCSVLGWNATSRSV